MTTHQQNAVLLPRLLGLRDHSPFILIKDTIAQTSGFLVRELLRRIPRDTRVVLLAFETLRAPERVDLVIDAREEMSLEKLRETVTKAVVADKKNLILIDSISYIQPSQFAPFLIPLMGPETTIAAVYHTDVPHGDSSNHPAYPSASTLLTYFATSVLTVSHYSGSLSTDGSNITKTLEENDEEEAFAQQVSVLALPVNCNRHIFRVDLTHRRKSGRSLEATYLVDSSKSQIDYVPERRKGPGADEDGHAAGPEDAEEVLKGLTTFNLGTTSKQREARDKVELPFLQAQEVGQGGALGGAIIYEFEKEDDYDEEDPYEDPF